MAQEVIESGSYPCSDAQQKLSKLALLAWQASDSEQAEAGSGACLACRHTVRLKTRSLLHYACHQLLTYLQVLVVGKLSQAVVLAGAAYRDEATFRERTGIANTKLVCDPVFDTQVSNMWPGLPRLGINSLLSGFSD